MEQKIIPGLTTTEAENRIKKYGPNDVQEKRTGTIKKFLAPFYSPISLMLLGAAFLSKLNDKTFDAYFILALYFVNYGIQKWQEFKADKSIQQLKKRLSFEVSVFRDNKWNFVNAKNLVPGDRMRLGLGSIIPADGTVISCKNLSANEAVLTGESLPKDKKIGDKIYSGSFIATGNLEAEITATGKNTFFGKTIFSIEQPQQKSILEKDILTITKFLTITSIIAVIILTAILLIKGFGLKDLLTLDLSLIIAGIPIALPAVMAIILSIGAAELAKKFVIVRRLSALQDLANVNMLLTDKTGTLTQNKINVANVISYRTDLSTDDITELAYFTTLQDTPDTIDLAIIKKFEQTNRHIENTEILNFIPYDSERKRSTALIQKGQEKILISMGAPQIIQAFEEFSSPDIKIKFEKDINYAAAEGFRVLAIAIRKGETEEKNMIIAGLLFLADPLNEDSKETIAFMRENGIGVKMVTGDNKIITERIAKEIGLPGNVYSAKETRDMYADGKNKIEDLKNAAAFSEVSPKDKYELVNIFRSQFVVAATGDGINDLPALKTANVGIAVSGAVTALKSLADIVLLGQGLSVIKDAIIEARKIFVRLYNYSIYRISESFRLVITILILGAFYGSYPLQPLQLILLAFLNDVPIISLAFDRVKISSEPSRINIKERFSLSLLFGLVGVLNSISLFVLTFNVLHFPIVIVQTMFFLKLTISGHALIFVAHTKERWFKFLPSKEVIIATIGTQILATWLAVSGYLMPAKISWQMAIFVWIWALIWMQITELMKDLQEKISKK
jgi:H+-transporting ATPase